jgi:hypothetical protein
VEQTAPAWEGKGRCGSILGEKQGRYRDPEARVGVAWNRGAAHSREEEGDGSLAQGKQQRTEPGKEN